MLNLYSDPAATQKLLAPQKFIRTDGGAGFDTFTITAFSSVDFDSLYHRSAGGVVTKLTSPAEFSKIGSDLVLTTPLAVDETLFAMSNSCVLAELIGDVGATVSDAQKIYVKRDSANTYTGLRILSEDTDLAVPLWETSSVTFTAGVSEGWLLTPDTLIGCAVIHNGAFRGFVTANTANAITIDDLTYTEATPAIADVFSVGKLFFAPDVAGVPGAYAPALTLADVTDDSIVTLWVKDTADIPASSEITPQFQIKITGTEV